MKKPKRGADLVNRKLRSFSFIFKWTARYSAIWFRPKFQGWKPLFTCVSTI